MIVLLLEKVPESLRGELTRWIVEIKAGVFVGTATALVRDKLWQKVIDTVPPSGGALLIHPAKNEQGFALRNHGSRKLRLKDYDGVVLIQKNHPNAEEAAKKLYPCRPTHKKGERPDWKDLPDVEM